MSSPLYQNIYIGNGATTNWVYVYGPQGWQGNTFFQAQPLGPVPTILTKQSPGLVTSQPTVFLNLGGEYEYQFSVTNTTANQSGYFTIQISSS